MNFMSRSIPIWAIVWDFFPIVDRFRQHKGNNNVAEKSGTVKNELRQETNDTHNEK